MNRKTRFAPPDKENRPGRRAKPDRFPLLSIDRTKEIDNCGLNGGEGGIRTHGRVSPTLAFEASSFNRSDTSPRQEAYSNGVRAFEQRLEPSRESMQSGAVLEEFGEVWQR